MHDKRKGKMRVIFATFSDAEKVFSKYKGVICRMFNLVINIVFKISEYPHYDQLNRL